MYPSTTSFYPAIVVENTMFERNTLVVQFDDEGAFELLHPNTNINSFFSTYNIYIEERRIDGSIPKQQIAAKYVVQSPRDFGFGGTERVKKGLQMKVPTTKQVHHGHEEVMYPQNSHTGEQTAVSTQHQAPDQMFPDLLDLNNDIFDNFDDFDLTEDLALLGDAKTSELTSTSESHEHAFLGVDTKVKTKSKRRKIIPTGTNEEKPKKKKRKKKLKTLEF